MNDAAGPFDRRLMRLRRQRCLSAGASRNWFLHRELAERLIDRLDDIRRPLSRVLDLGSGTDDLARRLALRPGTEIVARLDPTGAALRDPGFPSVVADEELLPFGSDRFDAVVGMMSLHRVNDLPGTLAQIRHALRPDGLLLVAFPGGESLGELRASLTLAELERTGGSGARVLPFVDLADAAALLQRTGYALAVADIDRLTVTYGDPRDLLRDLRQMGETNILRGHAARPLRRDVLARAIKLYREHFCRPDGRVTATFEFLFLTGWKPHPAQPKPLPRGSGQVNLARWLGRKP